MRSSGRSERSAKSKRSDASCSTYASSRRPRPRTVDSRKYGSDERRHTPSNSYRRSGSGGSSVVTTTISSSSKNRLINGGIIVISFCIVNIINLQGYLQADNIRRRLLGPPKLTEEQISKSRSHNLLPVDYAPDKPSAMVAWSDHPAPFAKMEELYECLGENIAIDMKGMEGHYGVGEFESARFRVTNEATGGTMDVDLSTFRTFMSSGGDDLLILTNEPYETVDQLFDREHQGRMFALFSNPVHRTVQRFMEREEGGGRTTLLDWVSSEQNSEENVFVKRFVGKLPEEEVNLIDLQMAKEFIRQSVVVGLSSDAEESFLRFNVAMGYEEQKLRNNAKCLQESFGKNDYRIDSFIQLVSPNSKEWNVIAKKNYLDMALYAYVEKLFDEHGGIFNMYPQDVEEDEPEPSVDTPENVDAAATGGTEGELAPFAPELSAAAVADTTDGELAVTGSIQSEPSSITGSNQGELAASHLAFIEIERKNLRESPYATPPAAEVVTTESEVTSNEGNEIGRKYLRETPLPPANVVEAAEVVTTEPKDTVNDGNETNIEAVQSKAEVKARLESRLVDVTSFAFGATEEATPFFWHVPKAGGTAIQNLYWCMGLTLANEVGGNPTLLQRKNVPADVLTVFQPWHKRGNYAKVINVDVTTHKGIANAKKIGFLTKEGQPHTDFVSSSLFHVVSMRLFNPRHKARMFALFRHPVERAVSKFYYLSKATWEPTFDETWANMTLEEWASNDRGENNWLVHHLAGKKHYEPVYRDDLENAKDIIKSKFIVGLMNDFDESVNRFNMLLGVDGSDPKNKQCIADFVQTKKEHTDKEERTTKKRDLSNRNSYTKAEEGSAAWDMLSKIHELDVELYSFIEEQYALQKHIFEQYEAQRIIIEQLQPQQVKTG